MEHLRLAGMGAKEGLGLMRSILLFHNVEWYFNSTVDEAIKIFIRTLYSCVMGIPVRYCARFINLSLLFS